MCARKSTNHIEWLKRNIALHKSFTNLQSAPAPKSLCHISQNAIVVQAYIFDLDNKGKLVKGRIRDDSKTAG